MTELKQVLKERNFHQNFVGNMFLSPPEGNFSRVNIFGEISSLSDFLDDSLYMFYEFALPYGWKIDNENSNAQIYATENYKEENINYLKSISQVSTGYVNPNAYSFKRSKNFSFYTSSIKHDLHEHDLKDLNCLIHNFSLPFELELLGHNSVLNKLTPKLLIQVNSVDSWGRHRIVGYTFINLLCQTGNVSLDVPCFKPVEDVYMKKYSFFLGGSRKIPDLRELVKTASDIDSNVESIMNRYGIKTEYSGLVHVNFNCIVQNRENMEKARKIVKERQGIENYNLVLGINTALGQKVADITDVDKQGQMQTSQHGFINRYGS